MQHESRTVLTGFAWKRARTKGVTKSPKRLPPPPLNCLKSIHPHFAKAKYRAPSGASDGPASGDLLPDSEVQVQGSARKAGFPPKTNRGHSRWIVKLPNPPSLLQRTTLETTQVHCFFESSPVQMPPPGGSICGRLTEDLPRAYPQGGAESSLVTAT